MIQNQTTANSDFSHHLRIKDSTLKAYQKGASVHIHKSFNRIEKINSGCIITLNTLKIIVLYIDSRKHKITRFT